MNRKRVSTIQETLEHQLNWPIKLRELSIKLQDKSYKIAREAIRLYADGLIDKETLREIIRVSGIPLSKHISPRKYERYDNEEAMDEAREIIINDFEEVSAELEEVEEEYVGQRIIRRLMSND